MLTGTELLTKVTAMQAQEPPVMLTDIVRACGYEIDGKLHFTQYYTELLNVKGLLNNDTTEDNEVSEEHQELYQKLCDSYTQDAVDAFLELYDENDLESFEDAYRGYYESEADFAEQFTTDVYGFDAPAFLVIDWEATWNSSLRYDFDFEDGFVFNKNW